MVVLSIKKYHATSKTAIGQWVSIRLSVGRLGVTTTASEQRCLGESVNLNRPGKKHNSGYGLPLIAVTKTN